MDIDWRTAGADLIHACLEDLTPEVFPLAAENEAFSDEHVRVLLKNPGLSGELLVRISRERRFFQKTALLASLLLHPKFPRARGLEIVRYLFWRDLLRVSSQPSVHPQLRIVAEHLLAERIPDLTLGEKMSIARTAGRAVLRSLREDPNPRVVQCLLRNWRCTEEDALFVAGSPQTPSDVLAVLARDSRWRSRQAVKSQLVRNRRLGLPIALGLLPELGGADLAAVARQADLPKIVRDAARRLLQGPARRVDTEGDVGANDDTL